MKTILTIFLGLFITVNFATAQDTLYVYKAGAVAYKSVISAVDSVTFQKVYVPPTSVTDIDGNVYKIVSIGTQTWMAENLKTTKYRDGSAIPNIVDNALWYHATTDGWCDFFNLPTNGTKLGHLYNWYAVIDSRNIAPAGWHVPTDAEWTTLINYLGGVGLAEGKLKEAGTLNWPSPNDMATNSSGFSAIPSGMKDGNDFNWMGENGRSYRVFWWSTTPDPTNSEGLPFLWYLDSNYNFVGRTLSYFTMGNSVRCIKD
ncbi:MAG: fibrobacter succinogenes major paralogous domain-containing protein [Paludibacter sp.]